MALNADVTAILRDMVQFLECLRDVKLPLALESIRDNLLVRSKDSLTMFMIERIGRSASPEPYLNMNAAGSRGLLAATVKTETELQEYVGADEQQQQQQQDYYETFQGIESANNVTPPIHETIDNMESKEETENTPIDIYANFSAAETKSKCQMCGPLYRKDRHKLFVFEQYRGCWVGLVGLHLLIYGNDRDNRPCMILPIHGYTARAAANAVSRDQRRSESAFEIFRPGSRTFQFFAKTRQDMEQWVTKICELGDEKNDCKEKETTRETDVNIVANNGTIKQPNDREDPKKERYQDVARPSADVELPEKSGIDATVANEESHESSNVSVPNSSQSHSPTPPPLPARIPQRLLIPSVRHSSQQLADEEEDDIYHKIEDFRDTIQYGNVCLGETSQIKTNNEQRSNEESSATYDDIQASVEKKDKFDEKSGKGKSDDTAVTLKDNDVVDEQDTFVSYDDVESIICNSKSTKVRAARKTKELTKSPQKRSFLDRVRSKKESPKKIEKKTKCKTMGCASRLPPLSPPPSQPSQPSQPSPPLANDHESSTYYDDVSGLTNVEQQTNRFEEQQSEYTCPPAPRPIYAKPPMTENAIDADEFYDDIACRDKSYQQTTKKPSPLRSLADADRPAFCENVGHSQQTFEDDEHYKTPRPDSRYPKCHSVDHQTNDLYDDVAILAEFTTRQKEILSSREKDNEGTTKWQTSPEKKPWNRFVGGRRSKTIDSSIAEGNGRVSQPTEGSSDELNEQHNSLRMNTFQKLISRMENSLGKASSRTTSSSILLNKANLTNSG